VSVYVLVWNPVMHLRKFTDINPCFLKIMQTLLSMTLMSGIDK